VLVLYVNVLLTFSYTFRILINLSSYMKISHSFFSSLLRESVSHFAFLAFLAFLAVSFITFWMWLYPPVSLRSVPVVLKIAPVSILLAFWRFVYFRLFVNLSGDIPTFFSSYLLCKKDVSLFVSSMVGLVFFWSSLVRFSFSTSVMSLWKTLESGFIPSIMFAFPSEEAISLRTRISQFYLIPVIRSFFILISFLFLGCLLTIYWEGLSGREVFWKHFKGFESPPLCWQR
jgi:hypothetical protein